MIRSRHGPLSPRTAKSTARWCHTSSARSSGVTVLPPTQSQEVRGWDPPAPEPPVGVRPRAPGPAPGASTRRAGTPR